MKLPHKHLVVGGFDQIITARSMFDPILTQLKVRTAAVQRQRFRRADNNFVIAAGDRYLLPGEERHGVVPGLNFHIS